MRLNTLLFTSLLSFGALSTAQAAFIDLNETTKVVFTQVTIDGVQITLATITATTTVDGVITVKRQTEKKISNGLGGFTKIETQETTVATPMGGVYTVVTTTDTIFVQIDASGNEGTPFTLPGTPISDEGVLEADLSLPQSTEFVPTELDETPAVISGA